MTRILTILALSCGVLLMLFLGSQSPGWMLRGEVLIVLTFALVYGFTAFSPALPSWFRYQEVRGVCLVICGSVALFVPTQFLVSAFLIGFGARLVMTADQQRITVRAAGKPLDRGKGDIVLRETGGLATRD